MNLQTVKKMIKKIVVSGVLGLAIFSLGIVNNLPKAEAHYLSYSEEYEIGEQAINQYRGQYKTYYKTFASDIIDSLIMESRIKSKTRMFQSVEVSTQPVINAYSFPSGWLVITDKMVDFCNDGTDGNQSTLAFVIAHEYAHFINEDFLRKIDKQYNTNLLFQIGAAFTGEQSINTQLITNIAQDFIKDLNSRQMSFRTEQQADEKGFQILLNTKKFSPGGAAVFFSRSIVEDARTGVNQNFTNPHSKSDVRLKRVLEDIKEISKGRVEFKNNKLYLDGKLFGPTGVLSPSKDGSLSGLERTYILAGNIAKAIHKDKWKTNNFYTEGNGEENYKLFAGSIFITEITKNTIDEDEIQKPIDDNIYNLPIEEQGTFKFLDERINS